MLPPGSLKLCDETELDRIASCPEHDRNRDRRGFGSLHPCYGSRSDDD
jgi:hypothetical protein